MELSYLKPDWPAPDNIGAVCTTRNGGFSTVPYDSFNLGLHVNDCADHVLMNRKKLQDDLNPGKGIIYLNQVHSTRVVTATKDMLSLPPFDADALVTRESRLALAIMTADCLPVLLCNTRENVIGNAHAGWRGLCGGIIENTVEQMAADPASTFAYLGPCIGPEAFEVGPEVRDAFIRHDPECGDCFVEVRNDKYYANLPLLAKSRLVAAGVPEHHIYGGRYCTFSQSDLFFSYRRDHNTGRMASLVWLK